MNQGIHASEQEHSGRGAVFFRPGTEPTYPPDLGIEPVHLEMDLVLDVKGRRLEGRVVHHLRARSPDVSTVRLHAVGFERVDVRDADGREVDARYDGREIRVSWAEAFGDGETRRLVVDYAVNDPITGLFFSGPTEAYPDDAWWAATDHETERARYWLPTIDLPNARPTLAMRLRADEGFTVLGPGASAGEERHGDGTKTVAWTLDQPCPSYITCFAVGDFVESDDGAFRDERSGEVACRYYTTSAFSPADLLRSFGRTKDMLAWMTRTYDHAFPFPKYYQFALPAFGGAMENISLVSWDDQFVLDETLAREWQSLVDVINVHEMAHSYFGDMVVCRDYAHAWLKESWATYTESLWLESAHGRDEADYHLFAGLDAYLREADESYVRPIVTRVFDHSWTMYDRHLYPGGAVRIHMLRGMLGDEAFFRGVRAYLKDNAFGVVETADFRRALEAASGRSLVRFFDQWFLGKGYPKVKATLVWDGKRKEATLTLEQTQVDEKKGVGLFAFDLDLEWVVKGTTRVRTVHLERQKHVVHLGADEAPEFVRIDPRGRAVMRLEFNPGDDPLSRQLREAPDVRGRILAARELCRTGRARNVRAVADAYGKEPFWGVRCRLAEALAEAGTSEAVAALATIVGQEQDPRVLEPLFTAAAKIRDPGLRRALEARLDRGLDLYRAKAALLRALGAQREDAPYERLATAAGEADRYGFVQSGALLALGETRREEALDLLLARLPAGATSNRARPAAAIALGRLARGLRGRGRERAVEALLDALRDPSDRVRKAAVQALATVGDAAAVGPLERAAKGVSDQERVAFERAVERIRKVEKPRVPELEKTVEELATRVRKAEDEIERLRARE